MQVAFVQPSAGKQLQTLSSARATPKQDVPRFLQKLYEIVEDPANVEMIRWSENGDAFTVLNQGRFSREVLGKWFKHQNFHSFVRQLNLYGFHKVSHLQHGSLKGANDYETVAFAHPNFRRGQTDLLHLIARKRGPAHPHADVSPTGGSSAPLRVVQAPSTQTVDVPSVIEGIAAIRRQQQAISDELNTLKKSNEQLWKEALAARERHAKHEDTINRILKFLAGVFGRAVEAGSPANSPGIMPSGVAPRGRLMIGDGTGVDLHPGDGVGNRGASPAPHSSNRFTIIDTPEGSVASPSIVPLQDVLTPASEMTLDAPPHDPHSPSAISDSALTPTTGTLDFAAPPAMHDWDNPDAAWQTALHEAMNTPGGQFQHYLQTLAQQQPVTQVITTHPVSQHPPSSSQLVPQKPASMTGGAVSPSPAELALLQNAAQMQKTYQKAADIDADVSVLQSDIHSLIKNMGLEPNTLINPAAVGNHSAPPPTSTTQPYPTNSFPQPVQPSITDTISLDSPLPDGFFESLLQEMNESGTGGWLPNDVGPATTSNAFSDGLNGEDFSMFFNDVPPPDSSNPVTSGTPKGEKRTLDMAELPQIPADMPVPPKRKR